MEKQVIISIGREFGSGGREIAGILGEHFQIPVYDDNLLEEIAAEKNVDPSDMSRYDEKPRTFLLHRRAVKGYSTSPEENIAYLQFEYMKKMADEGKSFIVVGHCAEEILKEYPCMVSVFIMAKMPWKIKRLSEYHSITKDDAEFMILRSNTKRKQYHNYYCDGKWGDARNYELCLDTSRIGVPKAAELIEHYVKMRQETD